MAITILDGGMGRELQRIGAPFKQSQWSALALMEDSNWVKQAHQNFIDAGCDIITTNAYACVPFHIGDELFKQKGSKLIKEASKIAKDTAKHKCKVAGCIPPIFGSYRPELFDEQKVKPIFKTLIENQKDDVDFWLFETTSSLEEFETGYQVLKQNDDKNLPVWVSFTLLDEPKKKPYLRSHQSLESILDKVCKQGIEAILFNCSIPEVMEEAVKTVHTYLKEKDMDKKIKIGTYANDFTNIGSKHEANNTITDLRGTSEDEYKKFAKKWIDEGATIVGGCCGITPKQIKSLCDLKKANKL